MATKTTTKTKAKAQKKAAKPVKKPTAKKASKATPKKTVVKKKTVVAKKPRAAKVAKSSKAERGVPEILRDVALKVLDERKAEDVVVADLRGKSAFADYAIAASGRAARQLAAIADYLREAFEKSGAKSVKTEGLQQCDWVLVDSGDVVVHLFRPEVRSYYRIEEIWKHKPRGA